jgi:hypothetical protein
METIYKGFIIKPASNSPSLLSVATEGRGGKIPKLLEGLFTSHNTVKHTIDLYLESKAPKEV